MTTLSHNLTRYEAGPAGQETTTMTIIACEDSINLTPSHAPTFKTTAFDRFQMVAALKKGHSRATAPPGARRRKVRGSDGPAVDLEDFISKHEIALHRTEEKDGSTFYHLAECPFKPGHEDGGPALIQLSNSEIIFKCFHGSCTERGWANVRRLYETRDTEEQTDAPAPTPDAGRKGDFNQAPAADKETNGRTECDKYRVGRLGLEMLEDKEDGHWCPLASFNAYITNEVIEDDGAEKRRLYEIEVTVYDPGAGEETFNCLVPAEKFDDLKWLAEHTSAKAFVNPTRGYKDHVNVAIRSLSTPRRRTIRKHLGWVETDRGWVYLNPGVLIGEAWGDHAPGEGIEVDLAGSPLGLFTLPQPPQRGNLVVAIRAALRMLDIGPESVTFPILAAAARSVLGASDFTVYIVGPSGAFKSQIAALGQQFFGGDMDSAHLPCSWMATANYLEAIAFQAKDAMIVIDDFAPTGTRYDVDQLHGKAERVLRAQGNNAGRGRASRDGTAQATRPPRGLILSTGEDTPKGFSALGRTYVVSVPPGDKPGGIQSRALTGCQRDAAAGLYAQAMAGYLAWLAPQYGAIKDGLRDEVVEMRDQARNLGGHSRTPEIVANLRIGLGRFLEYALDAGAVTEAEAKRLGERGREAIESVAQGQSAHQTGSEPVARFLELLAAAVAGGKAHIARKSGHEPFNPRAHGWREVEVSDGKRLVAQGDLIGWEDGDSLYLSMEAAYRAAQIMARESEGLAISPKTMATRIKERGLLLSTEAKRNTPLIRRYLGGAQQSVLHIAKKHVVDESAEDEVVLTAEASN